MALIQNILETQKIMKPAILVTDDDSFIRDLLKTRLTNDGYTIRCAENAAETRQAFRENDFQTVLLDLRLPDGDGISLMKEILETAPDMPVIIITAHGGVEEAVEAMRYGAYDFCQKPIDFNRLTVSVKNAVERYALKHRVNKLELTTRSRLGDLVGGSPEMQVDYHIIETVAPAKAPVLITGESGTGKELVAKAIHQLSPRCKNDLIDVNCAAIPKDLMESELFGHEAHAFTGAKERRIGCCERAHRSSLFLDEIAEMDVLLQAKLLRFLQEHAFYRVGGKEKISVDIRPISATNRIPQKAIAESQFREDLYYRLNVVHIPIPPLRDHPEDIPELAGHFLFKYSEENGKSFQEISDGAFSVLCAYSWPGNVRELENCIQQAVVLNDGARLSESMLPEAIRSTREGQEGESKETDAQGAKKRSNEIIPFERVERDAIDNALRVTKGNVAKASAGLHLSQATLYRKIRDYNLVLNNYKTNS